MNKDIRSKAKKIIKPEEDGEDKRAKRFLAKYFSFRSKYAQRLYVFLIT
ncbi:MAG: hypothetical protein H5T85_07400, partial [Actinobacteria bacterium]|nr:hypothetical protein [Actinomycetota bacterium]